MSEERLEQEQREDETEDVEAHKRRRALTDEPAAEEDEGGDDVEAHRRRRA
jgi:hypothetical protein